MIINLPRYENAIKDQFERLGTIKTGGAYRVLIYQKEPPYGDIVKIGEIDIARRYFSLFVLDMVQYKDYKWVVSHIPVLTNESFLG